MKKIFNKFFEKLLRKKKRADVLFICHRPAVWGSLASVYNALISDERFNVTILAIPNKKQDPLLGFDHENYHSEGAEAFFADFKGQILNGYDYENKSWLDISFLSPDYVFFQQPYDICRPPHLSSSAIAKRAKVCYVHYANNFIGGGVFEETYPLNFVKNVSFFFTQNSYDDKVLKEYLNKNKLHAKTYMTGFPRYDHNPYFTSGSSAFDLFNPTHKSTKILWTPRWTTNEGNCSFFDYKNRLFDFANSNQSIHLLFRPHPQAFQEWLACGLIDSYEIKNIYDACSFNRNLGIDTSSNYYKTIFDSDFLISDVSSFIADFFFLTKKPIIYCHKKDCFNEYSRKLSTGFYWVRNFDELKDTIELLQQGYDPLKEVREKLASEQNMKNLYGAGNLISRIIWKDFQS